MKTYLLLAGLLAGTGLAAMAQKARPATPPVSTPAVRPDTRRDYAPGTHYGYHLPVPAAFDQMVVTGQVLHGSGASASPATKASVAVKLPSGAPPLSAKTDASGNFRLAIPAAVLATLPDSVRLEASALLLTSQTIKVKKAAQVSVVFHLQLMTLTTESGHINFPPPPPPPPPPLPPTPTTSAEQAFWPPPQCSTLKVLDQRYFAKAHTLAQVDAILSEALNDANYDDLRYYYAPGGFVLITRIEQTDANGIALPGKARWSVNIPDGFGSSFASYLKALLIPPAGHFRVIAFAVTNEPINRYRAAPSQDEALKWLQLGADALAPKVGALPYDASYHCTALIYEFQRSASSTGGLVVPAQLSARQHLSTSRIAGHLPKIQP